MHALILALKSEVGEDIGICGGAGIVNQLIDLNLIDKFCITFMDATIKGYSVIEEFVRTMVEEILRIDLEDDISFKITLPVIQLETLLRADEKLVYQALSGKKKMSSTEIAEVTGFGKTKVVSLLKSLSEQGYVKIEGSGRGTKYLT